MYKKILLVLSLFLLVAAGPPAKAALVAYYPLDGNYNDMCANPSNGTPVGSPTFEDGYYNQAVKLDGSSQYVDCGNPAKLNLTSTITIMCWAKTDGTWGPSNATLLAKGSSAYRLYRSSTRNYLRFYPGAGNSYAGSYWGANINDGEWHHVAGVYDGTTITLYIDGEVDATGDSTAALTVSTTNLWIGNNSGSTGYYWKGWIDEVMIYDTALTLEQVIAASSGPGGGANPWAHAIYPQDGQIEVPVNSILSWNAGGYAATHNVYLSTNRDDVNAATTPVSPYQLGTTYDPGIMPYNTTYYWRIDEVNSPGTAGSYTYQGKIWSFTTDLTGYPIGYSDSPVGIDRIETTASSMLDAESDPNMTIGLNNTGLKQGSGPYKGYYVDANHSTVAANTMWLTEPNDPNRWIQYIFDKKYRLKDMLVWNYNESTPLSEFGIFYSDFGIKDVNIYTTPDYGANWSSFMQTTLQKGTEEPTYQAIDPVNGNDVDMADSIVTGVKLQALNNWSGGQYTGYGLSEVLFLAAPSYASHYSVTTGNDNTTVNTSNTTVDPNTPNSRLNWQIGRDGPVFADSHKLYIKDVDNDGATNATPDDPNSARNAVRDNTIAALTTTDPNYLLSNLAGGLNMQSTYYWRVDEVIGSTTWANDSTTNNYRDIQRFRTDGSRLVSNYEAFSDQVGGGYFVDSPVHGGSVAFRVAYNNTSGSVDVGPVDPVFYNINQNNWQPGNPTKMVAYFYGDPNNTGTSLYLKLGDTKIVYGANPAEEDTARLLIPQWTRWNVPLAGVSLSNVTGVTYGVDKVGSGTANGQLFFDDLTLYRLYPPPPTPTKPDDANLLAYYKFDGDAKDYSGHNYNGTMYNGDPIYSSSLATAYGTAVDCNGADYVDLDRPADGNVFNPAGDFSISVWINPTDWSSAWANVIVSNYGEGSTGWQVRRGAGGGNGNRMVFTTRGIGNDDFYSVQNILTNKWTHIVCVFDSVNRTKSIYLDGSLDNTGNTTGSTIGRTACNTLIGARAGSDSATATPTAYFTGQIDEVRMYDRVLTDNEVMYLANPVPTTVTP